MCLKINKDKIRMTAFSKFKNNLKILDHPDIIKVFDLINENNDK